MLSEPKPIRDYCLGIFDGPHATPAEADEGPYFLGIKNITEDGRLDFSEPRYVSETEFPKWTRRVTPTAGDVVFTYEATLHRYALIPDDFRGCLGRRVALVRPDPAKADSRFLLYYFLSQPWRAVVESNIISGATVDRIPLERFPQFPIVLPELARQQAIAEVLAHYDDLIDNNRRRIKLLEESVRLVFNEWFVRLRFPGHGTTAIIDGVPAGWTLKPLGNCLVLNYGKALKSEDRCDDGNVLVYGSSGIVGQHNKALVTGPGIILGRKGSVGSVFWSGRDFWPIDTVYFVDRESSDLYLFQALQRMQFISTDVAVPGLNRDFAYSRQLLEPTPELRRQFLGLAELAQQQIDTLAAANQRLRAARDLLLHRLMSGELTV